MNCITELTLEEISVVVGGNDFVPKRRAFHESSDDLIRSFLGFCPLNPEDGIDCARTNRNAMIGIALSVATAAVVTIAINIIAFGIGIGIQPAVVAALGTVTARSGS
jgi:hypothetical protein